jgi:hypothetical protein
MFNVRSGNVSIFKYGFDINKMFILGWIISATLTLFAFNSEFMRNILHIESLNIYDFAYVVFFALFVIVLEEIRKFFKSRN